MLPCIQLPLANDTLVVLKTGSTELQDKLPIHLNTTLWCYPNYAIYSDAAITFRGNQIFDSLEGVNPDIKAGHEEFALYRRLQEQSGRAALQQFELSGPDSKPPVATGKLENPGWKLDKWKFLPLMRSTFIKECSRIPNRGPEGARKVLRREQRISDELCGSMIDHKGEVF